MASAEVAQTRQTRRVITEFLGRAPRAPEARIFALDALAPLFLESIAVFAGFRRDDDRVVTIVAVGGRLPPDTKMREEAAGCAVDGLEAGIVP